MTLRLNQPSGSDQDEAAARLARRLERECRARAERKRAIIIMSSLACAGALLLGIGGVALAARAGDAPAGAQSTASVPSAVAVEPTEPVATEIPEEAPAADALVDGGQAAAEPAVAEPADPPKKPAPTSPKTAEKPAAKKPASSQRLKINIGGAGYEPTVIRASSSSPITLTVGKGEGCAAGFTIPSLGISEDNSTGPVTIDLGKLDAGTYRFACAMDMVEGQLVVK